MEKIILDKFEEWTKGLGAIQARISIFNHIRDIPYMIIPQLRDPARGPVGILEYNRGMCSAKHYLLALMFGKLNIPTKYVTYQFSWNDPKIKYPKDLMKLAQRLLPEYHLACRAYIDGKWVLIDATWDPPLKKVGFPINENWDGMSDTKNAVTPIKEIIHETIDERLNYVAEAKKSYTEEQKLLSDQFKEKLNNWLEGVRSV